MRRDALHWVGRPACCARVAATDYEESNRVARRHTTSERRRFRDGTVGAEPLAAASERGRTGDACGSRRRGRTWQATIFRGEARAAFDPRVSEWGNPPREGAAPAFGRGEPAELKHLSRRRKGKQE